MLQTVSFGIPYNLQRQSHYQNCDFTYSTVNELTDFTCGVPDSPVVSQNSSPVFESGSFDFFIFFFVNNSLTLDNSSVLPCKFALTSSASFSNDTGFFHVHYNTNANSAHSEDFNFGGAITFTVSSSNADANGHGKFEYSPTLSGSNYYALNSKNLAEFG